MLPKKWYIKGCEKLADWAEDQGNCVNIFGGYPNRYYWLRNKEDIDIWESEDGKPSGNFIEITFEEFEKYALNKTPEIKEDMSYLIKVLKRCNIK